MTNTTLFIDADNQSPSLATALFGFLRAAGRSCTRATVAGNGVGDRVRSWEKALQEADHGLEIRCHVAPRRKQSADVRLMFELAPFYHSRPDPAALIIVLSRDDMLIAAAECLAGEGHNVLLMVAASGNNAPVAAELPVVVLPAPQQAVAAPQAPAPGADLNGGKKDKAQTVSDAIASIRRELLPNKQGGYLASAVGQVLSKLGHDKAARAQIVRAIPNLKEAGVGSDKHLIF